MTKFLLILILLYLYNFYKLGNTLIRIDSNNKPRLMLSSIIESFVGPIRSIFLFFITGNYRGVYEYIIFESTNTASPYFYIIIFFIYKNIFIK